MKGLTKRQREIIDYIQDFICSNRYSPSFSEICLHFGFTFGTSDKPHMQNSYDAPILVRGKKSSLLPLAQMIVSS